MGGMASRHLSGDTFVKFPHLIVELGRCVLGGPPRGSFSENLLMGGSSVGTFRELLRYIFVAEGLHGFHISVWSVTSTDQSDHLQIYLARGGG